MVGPAGEHLSCQSAWCLPRSLLSPRPCCVPWADPSRGQGKAGPGLSHRMGTGNPGRVSETACAPACTETRLLGLLPAFHFAAQLTVTNSGACNLNVRRSLVSPRGKPAGTCDGAQPAQESRRCPPRRAAWPGVAGKGRGGNASSVSIYSGFLGQARLWRGFAAPFARELRGPSRPLSRCVP